jgi:hypothetical protein
MVERASKIISLTVFETYTRVTTDTLREAEETFGSESNCVIAGSPMGSDVSSTSPTHDRIMITRADLASWNRFCCSSTLELSKSVKGESCGRLMEGGW